MMNAIQKLSLELAAAEQQRSPKVRELFTSRPRPERHTNRLQVPLHCEDAAPRRPGRPRRG